jgi:hypothetical protein
LALGERADEEVGVVATGALFLGRHPVGPRPEQVGAQDELLRAQEVREGQRVVGQRGPRIAIDRRVAHDTVGIVGRPREEDTGLLERLARGGADECFCEILVDVEAFGPP